MIRKHTVVAAPYLCPEIRLHLITDACPLWTATEAQVADHGLVDPYWAFCWAGGQALARHLLDHPSLVSARTVLDFGAGGGVEAVAAALAGAHVTAADIDPIAADAALLNADLNGVEIETITEDLVGTSVAYDVVLAGDVCYERTFATRVLEWLRDVASAGALVLLADPGRGYIDTAALTPLATYAAPADVDADGTHLVDTTIYAVLPR